MSSHNGRYVISFNGEIYNHLELRERIDNEHGTKSWRGTSDTESLVEAIDAFGFEETLKISQGMFAFALWDREKRSLFLARDRFGEKPLYYAEVDGALLFSSELRAFRCYPSFRLQVDRHAAALFFRYKAVPAPYAIYRGVKKLMPASYIRFDSTRPFAENRDIAATNYWSVEECIRQGLADPFEGGRDRAASELDSILTNAVQRQLMSDVPLGTFLSGGLDSSLIVSLIQKLSTKPARTFTIGFAESAYSEIEQARAIAAHLGTEHAEVVVTGEDALSLIPDLSGVWCEPFADPSQLPTLLVCRIARRDVTVALSGDGGDEVFGGYNRHVFAATTWRKLLRTPQAARSLLAGGLRLPGETSVERFVSLAERLLGGRSLVKDPGYKVKKLAGVLCASGVEELYDGLTSLWQSPDSPVLGCTDLGRTDQLKMLGPDLRSDLARMMLFDTLMYLPDDILTKVDRAAMSVGLETRIPFLSEDVFRFAWRLPLEYKIEGGKGKAILRDVLGQYVPRELFERPKQGFDIPLRDWLRGPLREWAGDLINAQSVADQGILDVNLVRARWDAHSAGKGDWQHQLWPVLMFQAWVEAQIDEVGSRSDRVAVDFA